MTDAPPKAKTAKGGEGDEKKRFEVKKVRLYDFNTVTRGLTMGIVERGCTMGLGYRCRQLRHLQKPHHGPL